jgi:phenylacetate-CoA ligase
MPSIRGVAEVMGLSVVNTELSPLDIPRMVHVSHFLKPDVWLALPPPMVSAVDEEATKLGLDPGEVFSSYKAILGGGDVITSRQKEMVEGRWGAKLYEVAGIGEMGFYPGECVEQEGQHVPEDLFLFEIIDPETEKPLPLTEKGEMVITTLLNKGTPAIRWKSEDICYFKTETCDCGRTHARLFYLGRKGFIVKIKGRMVFPNEITLTLEEIEGAEHGLWQIIEYADDMETLRLRIGFYPELEGRLKEMGEAIVAKMEGGLGLNTEVDFVKAEELLAHGPPHKVPRIHKE